MKDILVKRLLALCFLLLLVGLVMPAAAGRSENRAEEVKQTSFSKPLPIPPLLEGTEKNGVLHFNLQVREG